jgi:hypothetical protein
MVGTAAGVVGGAVLGSRFAKKPKKVLGVSVPGTGGGLNSVAKEVAKATKQVKRASKQFGDLADEVRTVRKKAEKVGDAFS